MEATSPASGLREKVLAHREIFESDLARLCKRFGSEVEHFELSAQRFPAGHFLLTAKIKSPKKGQILRILRFKSAHVLTSHRLVRLEDENKGEEVTFSYNSDCDPTDILSAVRKEMRMTLYGLRCERLARAYIKSLRPRHPYILAAKFAPLKEDAFGVDLRIYVKFEGSKTKMVPLQIKSREFYQDVHIRKNSRVPSMVFGVWRDKLEPRFIELLKAYANHRTVLHIAANRTVLGRKL